jgi:ubiquinone/menaquinone biosynthesis C-methylase UbiE
MAAKYDRSMGFFERHVLGDARAWAVSHAWGDVVEIAVGTGLNLPLYQAGVGHVIGIELSEQMLALARQRTVEAGLVGRVEIVRGDAQALDLPDESADTVVSTYAFCTIPDPLAASREAWRVLRPGGTLVLAEHGPPTNAVARLLMRIAEPLSVRCGADHLLRNPLHYVRAAGFEIVETHRQGLAGVVFRVLARKTV